MTACTDCARGLEKPAGRAAWQAFPDLYDFSVGFPQSGGRNVILFLEDLIEMAEAGETYIIRDVFQRIL